MAFVGHDRGVELYSGTMWGAVAGEGGVIGNRYVGRSWEADTIGFAV